MRAIRIDQGGNASGIWQGGGRGAQRAPIEINETVINERGELIAQFYCFPTLDVG